MAAPTQELPPWYTIMTTTLTDNAGEPTATTTTLLYLPLTYYGPSIPLDQDWTYGGLSPPASSETAAPSAPSSSDIILTSSNAIPTSIPSAIPSSDDIPSITPSSQSPSPPTPSPPFDSSALSGKNRNIAIIVGTVFGFLFLLSVACLLFCWLHRYRKRSASVHTRLSDEDFVEFVPASLSLRDEGRQAGEGSPRHSGEEADPFLRPHGEMSQVRPRVGFAPVANIARDSVSSHPQTINTLTNTSTTGSGYGNVIASPYSNETFEPQQQQQQRGHILTVDDIRRISNEEVPRPWASNSLHSLPIPPAIRTQPPSESQHGDGDDDDDSSPLIPPPPISHRPTSATPSSRTTLDQEQAELLTAQRIQFGQPTIRALPPQPRGVPSSWKDRIPFFKDTDSTSSKNSPVESLHNSAVLSSVPDSISYQPLDSEASNSANRRSMLAGSRPVSGVSGTSTGTVYYDARSTPDNSERSGKNSGRGTPLSATELGTITPLPRAAGSGSNTPSSIPPVPPLPAQYDHADILDAPVPTAVPFRMPVRPDGAYMASRHPFTPPSLGASTSADVLEDEPPRAALPWKSIAQKSTFGRFTPTLFHSSPLASEHTSYNARSTGSDPSSGYLSPPNGHSRTNLHGSSSSRGTYSSLAHSGSVSSHGGHGLRHQHMSSSTSGYRGPISPALSAFGPGISPSPVSTPPPPSNLPPRPRPKSDTDMVDGAYEGPSIASGSTDRDSETLVTPTEGLDEFPDVPWAGGLDADWKPISPMSATFNAGGRW